MKTLQAFKEVAARPLWGPVFLAVPCLFLMGDMVFGLANMDTYFHIRVGSEILEGNWKPWKMGHFNEFDNASWISTQWLSQVIFAAIYKLGGYKLMVLFMGAYYLTFVTAVYHILRKYSTGLTAGLATLAFVWSNNSWISLRPQVISFFLILLTTHLWIQASKSGRLPWLVIPLMALWPNLHGMWIAGIVNIAAFTFAYCLDRGWSLKPWLLLGCSLMATLANPYGWAAWTGVVTATTKGSGAIGEWGPPSYLNVHTGVAFLIMGLAIVMLARASKVSWMLAAVTFMASGWAVWSQRSETFATLMFLLVIVTLANNGDTLKQAAQKFAWMGTVIALVLASTFGLLVMSHNPDDGLRSSGVAPWTNRVLDAMPAHTNVFTTYQLANYSLFAHPDVNMILQGYVDSFTADEIERMNRLRLLGTDWPDILSSNGVAQALMPQGLQMGRELVEEEGWRVIHSDDAWVYMVAPGAPTYGYGN